MSDKDLDPRPPASGPAPTPTLTPRCEFCGSDSIMPGGWIDGVCVAEICLGCGTKRPYPPLPPSSSLGAATATAEQKQDEGWTKNDQKREPEPTPSESSAPPTLRSLFGSVPGLTGGLSSEEYVRRQRDAETPE